MTQEQIHKLFKRRFNQNNWKQFLFEAHAIVSTIKNLQIILAPN